MKIFTNNLQLIFKLSNICLIIFEDDLKISSVTYLDQERAKNLVAF